MQHFSPRWLLTFGVSLLTLAAVAQAPAPRPSTPWTDAPAARAALATTHWAGRLTAFRPVTADPAALAATLAQAPLEGVPATPLILTLPHPDGSLVRFQVVEAPVMAPALAAQFPNIKTYAGIGLDDPTATLRADLTPEGFHAQVLSRREGGTFYIDPIQNTDMARGLVVYDRRNLRPLPGQRMVCETGAPGTGTTPAPVGGGPTPLNPTAQRVNTSLGGTLRTYRLAVAATGEYTTFHGGTVAQAQAAIVTTINRVTGVYEKELAVRMVLVANNTSIIYTNAGSDPYQNTSNDLNANQTNINTVIGSANYDIGHLVGTGGGGVAQLGSVCGSGKARGLTGSGSPVNDAFDIDYVAHEIGHQFSGNHPFNGSTGSCTGSNRNASTAWEPGSGSTIQGYAGICAPQNLQANSDAYFHGGNISEMTTFINSTVCPTTAASGNTPPTVGTPANASIPASTPFRLTATATDTDGDVLSYCWEEMDLGPQGAPVTTTTQTANSTVPLFRSFSPVASATRYFPRLNELRNNTVAYGEFLPSVARTMAFRCTVRDQRFSTGLGRIVGGLNQSNTVTLTVINTGTPFVVTSPNTAVSYAGGSTQAVTWTVGATAVAPISCATVNIRLSTDGGLTFPTVLAAAEPNDGSANVTIPNTPSTTCRVMVEANDNYFFDISNTNFTITPGVNSPTITSFTPTTGGVGTSVTITGTNLTGTSAVRFNGVAATTFANVNATTVTATVPAGASTGFIGLTATTGTATSSTVFTVPGPPTITSFTPTSGSAGTSVTVTGTNFTGATGATFNGTAAAVTVVNATTITTTAPAGVTTGPISITTPLGTGTSATNFTLTGANDQCTGTLPLLACGGSVTGTTVGSTSTNDPTATCSTITIEPAAGGIWYRFVGTGGSTTLSTNGATYDSKLFVYSGSCAALVCVTANDDISMANLASTVTFTGTAGTTYFIFVSGFQTAQGTFTLTATCTAPTITSFTPNTGPVGTSVSVTGTLLATASAVTVNNVAGTITGTPTATNVTFTVGAGSTTGLIRITTGAGVATSATNFTVTVPPANDECTGTLPLLACGGSVTGTTVGSTSTNDPTATCSTITIQPAAGGVWYRFIGTGGSTTLSTNGAAYDSKLFVYSGSCAALTCVTANDDIGGGNFASTVTFTGAAGTPYFIFVSGFNSAQGTFTLTATCTAPTITSFTPTSGPVGTSVSVTGTLLATASALTVNNVAGTITGTPTATNVTFTVGAGSTTGLIRITTGAGVATSATNFTVTTNQAPTALNLSNSTIAENTGANAVVGSLSTTDPDAANTFTYTLVTGTGSADNALVNISGNSLRITASPNFEAKSSYAVRVRTTDQGGLFFEQPFTLTITNVNETPTALNLSNSTIAENTGANAVVGSLSTTDPDAANTFTYTLVTGTGSADNALVNISGNSLRITASPNFEAKSSYAVRVRTTDQGGLFFERAFTVTITNVNETPTALNLSNNTIAENTGANAVVGSLSTTDPDAANTFTYTLVTGTGSADNALVNISGNSLRITASPNFEAKASYAVRVRTTDQGGLFFERAFTLTITDVAEPTIAALGTVLGPEGTSVVVTGTNLTGTTSVTFNGTNAPDFVVNSATQLTATVPVGATSGTVSVVTPNGSATSGASFAVLPIFTGTFNQCLSTTSITSTGAGTWQYLRATNGDLVAAINDQGTALGTVSVDFNLNQAAVRADAFGREYLDRNWKLTAQNAFVGQSVRVRFYARNAEFAAYTAANDGDASDVTAVSQLRLTQYSGPNEDCQLGNNGTGPGRETRLLTPASNEVLAGANWFALETVVADHFSEFFFNGGAVPVGGDGTLPVELTSFEAHRPAPTQVTLTWRTASERNNRGYVVQRSTDRRAFTAVADLIAGAGTTQSPQAYAYTDPSAPASLLYYRLLQVDNDGSSTYSNIVAVQPAQPETQTKQLVLWPNPARSTVQVSGLEAGPVEVLDGAGRVVRTLAEAARAEAAATLPLAGLPAGVYGVRNAGRVQRLVIE